MSAVFANCPNCGGEYMPIRRLPDGTLEPVPFHLAFRLSTSFNEPNIVDDMICPKCSPDVRNHWFKNAERVRARPT